MARVIKKSYKRVIEQTSQPGYNESWKPEQQANRGLLAKYQAVLWLLIVTITAALFLGVFQQASAKGKPLPVPAGSLSQQQLERVSPANVNIETGGVQGEIQSHETVQPGIWFGPVASLAGALVMGLSFLVLQRQKE